MISDQWARFSRPAAKWLVKLMGFLFGAQCRFIRKSKVDVESAEFSIVAYLCEERKTWKSVDFG